MVHGDPNSNGNAPKPSAAGLLALVAEGAWWRQAAAGFLLAAFAYVAIAPAVVPLVVPVSYYYTLDGLHVENAAFGKSPEMVVARQIKREFRGWYDIEIERVNGSAYELFAGCGSYGMQEFTYRPGRVLPNPLTLDWWMGIPPNRECQLPPGDYRIITEVHVRSFFDAVLTERVVSNTFTVRTKRK
jgi:hypothetical protein